MTTQSGASPTVHDEQQEKASLNASSEESSVVNDGRLAHAKEKEEEHGSRPHTPSSNDGNPPNQFAIAQPRPRWLRYLLAIKWFVLDQYFLFGFALIVIIASQVQVPKSQQSTKETVIIYTFITIIFLITGLTLPTKILIQNYAKWKVHIFVQLQSYLMTSAIVFAVVTLTAINHHFMDAGLLVGLIFMGCVPTTISSNIVMTRRAHGNDALTVVQSTIGNVLGPFLTPLLLQMYTSTTGAWYSHILPPVSAGGGYGELYRRVFKQLGLSMFLPLAVGQVVQNTFPTQTRKVLVEYKVAKLNSVAMLLILWQTYDGAFAAHAFTSVPGSNMIFVVFISIAFYILWTAICIALSLLWLDRKDTVAIAYCVPAKSVAIGVPLTAVLFPGMSTVNKAKLSIPLVIFQGLQIAAGSLLTPVFRRWADMAIESEKRAEKDAEVGTDGVATSSAV